MDEFDDREETQLDKLVERFMTAVDKDQPIYLDMDDLEDVIRSLLNQEQLPYAQKAIRQAVTQYPNDPYFRIYLAHYYHLKQEFDSEERELDYIESHFEPIPDTYYQRVLSALINGKSIDVIGLLEKAISIDDVLPEVRLLLAYEFVVRKELQRPSHTPSEPTSWTPKASSTSIRSLMRNSFRAIMRKSRIWSRFSGFFWRKCRWR